MSTYSEEYKPQEGNNDFVKPKITTEYVVNLIQGTSGYTGWWIPFLIPKGKEHPVVVGSYVYKHLIRGEDVDDVDFACNSSILYTLSDKVIKKEKLAYNPRRGSGWDEDSFTDYKAILFTGSNIHADLVGTGEFISKINNLGLSPVNSLVMTREGVKHVLEVPEFEEHLNFKVDNPKAERDWMIKNLKEGRYCKWNSMREKDKEYFKNWDVIDFQECRSHGIFESKN